MVPIKKGDIVFNHEQSVQLLKNGHISGRGKAYADGTVGDKFASGVLRPLQPGDRMWELIKKAEEYMKQTGEDVRELLSPVNVIKRDMEQMTQSLNTVNNVSNNRTQSINIGDININCPGITDQEVARQVGIKVNDMFNGLHLNAYQQSKIK